MPDILKGSTDVTRYVMLRDSAAGTPETGYTITSLDLQYTRNRVAPAAKVDATALAATDSTHADNKAIEIDATSSPGLYRVDWPDAAFATGVDKVILVVSGTGLDPAVEEIDLVNYNSQDGVRLGLTALPNAAADAAGGLPISDAGGLDLDAQIGTDIDAILADTNEVQISLAAGGLIESMVDDLQSEVDGIQADTEDIQSRLPAALVNSRMDCTIDGTGMETGAVDNILNRDASASTTNSTLGAIINDWENGGRLDLIVDDILADTAVIGAAGAGLSAVPWNAAWDTEVQSEVDDALIAKGLDHLVFTSVTGTDIADNSIIAYLASKSATADWDSYVNTTDSLEANRDNIGTTGAALASIWTISLTEAYPTDGSAGTAAQILYLLLSVCAEFSISSTTITCKKLDGSTTAATYTLDSATAPTSRTRAT